MKLNQSQLRQIIKEELKRTLKEEKYKATVPKSVSEDMYKRWEPNEPEYEKADNRLKRLESVYPVMIGALTLRNPVTRDACIQELAAVVTVAPMSGRPRLELADELGAVEKALKNVFKVEEGFYTLK